MQLQSKGVRLLQAFTNVLAELDPFELGDVRPHEYEPEALSALARFNELHLGCLAEEALDVAREIVRGVFDRVVPTGDAWRRHGDFAARELLAAYLSEPADAL